MNPLTEMQTATEKSSKTKTKLKCNKKTKTEMGKCKTE